MLLPARLHHCGMHRAGHGRPIDICKLVTIWQSEVFCTTSTAPAGQERTSTALIDIRPMQSLPAVHGRKAPMSVLAIANNSIYTVRSTSMSRKGAYCWAPKISGSPALPLGRSRLIVNLIALAGSNITKSVILEGSIPSTSLTRSRVSALGALHQLIGFLFAENDIEGDLVGTGIFGSDCLCEIRQFSGFVFHVQPTISECVGKSSSGLSTAIVWLMVHRYAGLAGMTSSSGKATPPAVPLTSARRA